MAIAAPMERRDLDDLARRLVRQAYQSITEELGRESLDVAFVPEAYQRVMQVFRRRQIERELSVPRGTGQTASPLVDDLAMILYLVATLYLGVTFVTQGNRFTVGIIERLKRTIKEVLFCHLTDTDH